MEGLRLPPMELADIVLIALFLTDFEFRVLMVVHRTSSESLSKYAKDMSPIYPLTQPYQVLNNVLFYVKITITSLQ